MNLSNSLKHSLFTSRLFRPTPFPPLHPLRHINTNTKILNIDDDIPLDPTYIPSSSNSTDPWAFLQGTPQRKTIAHDVPTFRKFPQHSTPFGHPINSPSVSRPESSPNTLCERERIAFAEIFEQILSNKKVFTQQSPPGVPFPSPSLNALFESAVGPQQRGNEISFGPRNSIDRNLTVARLALASSFEQFTPTLRQAAAKAAGVFGPLWTIREMEEIKEQLGDRILEMNLCETDLELGAWMEEHVFSMVSSDSSSKSFPPGSYAFLLAEGMRILRSTFNDLQGVYSIFNRIKMLGAESYVVGCSVDVYNQVIAARWEGTRDLYQVKGLVDEMETNGIQGNPKTLLIIRDIMEDVATVDKTCGWTHGLFSEGNEEVFCELQEKMGVWEQPKVEGGMFDSLKAMSV